MQTNLTMVGGKWAVEIIGGPNEETLTKTFSGREQATNQIRLWGNGQSEMPILKKKRVKSEKSVKPKKVEAVKT
jgi:hypothetical protein